MQKIPTVFIKEKLYPFVEILYQIFRLTGTIIHIVHPLCLHILISAFGTKGSYKKI